jgi:hypothetical protein
MLYVIVFMTGFAGLFHAPWWAAVVGACILTLYLLAEEQDFSLAHVRWQSWVTAHTTSSLLIGLFAGPLAFGAGQFAGFVWGV